MGIFGFGIRYSFGVFFKSLEDEFGPNRTATSGVFSAYMFLCGIFSILGGWALDKYGPKKVAFIMGLFTGLSLLLSSQVQAVWQLYITYSLLLALGNGSIFSIVNSTTSRWFIKRRGFIIGIASSAGAIGQVVLVPFATVLIANFTWRLSFIILGIVALAILLPLSWLMKRDPNEIGLLPDGIKPDPAVTRLEDSKNNLRQDGLLLSEAYKTREFWLLGLIWLFLAISVNLILTHSVPNATDLGISHMDAALIISFIGVGGVVGRLSVGRLSDSIGRKIPVVICAIIQVGTLIWLIWIKELWMFYLFALIFGYGWGGLGSVITVLVSDVFGVRSIGVIMGAITAGWMVGAAIGPAVGGMVYDITGNYAMAFAVAAFGMIINTIFALLVRSSRIKRFTPGDASAPETWT